MARRHRSGYLFKRGRKYWIEYWVEGKRVRQSLGVTTLKAAKKERDRIMAPLRAETHEDLLRSIAHGIEDTTNGWQSLQDQEERDLPFGQVWDAYMSATNRPDTGALTLQVYRQQYAQFEDWVRKRHPESLSLRYVTDRIAEEYAQHLTSLGIAPGTFNKHVRVLTLVFRVLRQKAAIVSNPWEDITRKKDNPQSRRELTGEELEKVIRSASGEIHALFAIGIYTGMRLGDCCTLRWAEVDLARGLIIRVPRKTANGSAKHVHIPIHPTLATILHAGRREQTAKPYLKELKRSGKADKEAQACRVDYVLPQIAVGYLKRADVVTDRIQKHFTRCGIRTHRPGTGKVQLKRKNGKYKSKGTRAVVEVGFHSLRHTFVSLCRESNAPLAVVEAIVGHANPAMTRHYTHVGDLAASQAVAALPTFVEANGENIDATTDEQLSPRDREIVTILEHSTAKTWKKDLGAVLDLVRGQ